ncbi:MAG: hypothetical protein JO239_01020, partial [Paraburkholderia sp.]|nr:hypothetical protein [Paraburkholderia sp.]
GAANRVAADGHVEGATFWFALPVESPPPLPVDVAESPAPDDTLETLNEPESEPAPGTPASQTTVDPKPAHE